MTKIPARIFLSLTILIVGILFSHQISPTVHAEGITVTEPVQAFNEFEVKYSGLENGACYVIRIFRGTYIDPPQGSSLSTPCYSDQAGHIWLASTGLGTDGSLKFSSRGLTQGQYQLILYKKECGVFGVSCNLSQKLTVTFSVNAFNSNCTVNVAPGNPAAGIVAGGEISVLVVGNFINTTDRLTIELLDQSGGSTGLSSNVSLTPTNTMTTRTVGPVRFPIYASGSYSIAVNGPTAPGNPPQLICQSNAFTVIDDPANPSGSRCSPPDIDPITNMCVNPICHVSSSGVCEFPIAALPTSIPTPTPVGFNPSISPVPPTLPPFEVKKCSGGNGIETGLGCISFKPGEFVSRIFGIILGIAGGVALLLIIYSGYRMIAAAGNPEGLQGARETLTAAIIGLLFIIFAFVILEVIGVNILGLPGFGK